MQRACTTPLAKLAKKVAQLTVYALWEMRMRFQTPGTILLLACVVGSGFCALAQSEPRTYLGIDSNEYPGGQALVSLKRHFDFIGYWLNNPPGARRNDWVGKRTAVVHAGFGFLVLANGKLDKQIKAAHVAPGVLGANDGRAAAAAATREGFPARTIIFLDQEEGGRLLPEQMAYLLGWTGAVETSGFRPGIYISGQPVPDGPGHALTTAQHVKAELAARHLPEVAMWVYQDACPPAPGCSLQPPALEASGTPGAIAWQYAQSPRRPAITASCAKTYAPDGNCYAGEASTRVTYDLSVAGSADPSQGR